MGIEMKDKWLLNMKEDFKKIIIDELEKLMQNLNKFKEKNQNGLDCQNVMALQVLLGTLTMAYCFAKDRILK